MALTSDFQIETASISFAVPDLFVVSENINYYCLDAANKFLGCKITVIGILVAYITYTRVLVGTIDFSLVSSQRIAPFFYKDEITYL